MRKLYKSVLAVAVGSLGLGLLSACSDAGAQSESSDATGDQVSVATSIYPMTFLAEQVVGDSGRVIDLAPTSGEAHDLELSPRQVSDLMKADVALYLGDGFQPPVEQAVAQRDGASVDALQVVSEGELRSGDPHIWLSPELMSQVAGSLADQLAQVDPDHADQFQANAERLQQELGQLDQEYRTALAGCAAGSLLTSHEAFGYLADRYGFEQHGVMGINPETEPSPKRLQEVQQLVKAEGIDSLFIEAGDSSGQKLAEILELTPKELHTLESKPEGMDYFEAMRANLESLTNGLGCAAG